MWRRMAARWAADARSWLRFDNTWGARITPSRITPRKRGWGAVGCVVLMVTLLPAPQASARVGPAGAAAPTVAGSPFDLEMRRAVLLELGADRHFSASGIEATAENGIIVLTGNVPVFSWKERATRVSTVVHGVRAVVNHIRVAPVSRPDRQVADDVRKALRATAALAENADLGSSAEGVVELSGAISSWEQQQLAERVARHMPGCASASTN